MSDSRILLLDRDFDRGDRIASLLDFMDFTPRLYTDAADIDLDKAHANQWLAVMIGDPGEGDAVDRLADWLGRHPHCPPVLLVEPARSEPWRQRIHPDALSHLDYPIRRTQLQDALRRASLQQLVADASTATAAPGAGPTGQCTATRELRRMLEQVAPFDTTVLILGESGTGKEVAAQAIHARSRRAGKPFVAINCGAIPPDLLESELFGHEKGAFTGALSQRKGRFEMAEGGTLLLDEIGDMSMPMQVKLLRVLQERSYERVGGNQTLHCDVRVIAATHRNLEKHIAEGKFREDLFYRLAVFPIEMPTLRQRADDLPELVADLLQQLGELHRGSVTLTGAAMAVLQGYAWPGNIRELRNLLERLTVLHAGGTVDVAELPARYRQGVDLDGAHGRGVDLDATAVAATAPQLQAAPLATASPAPVHAPSHAAPAVPVAPPVVLETDPAQFAARSTLPPGGMDLRSHIAGIEQELIHAALEQAEGVVARAADLLGLRRTTLVEKLRKYPSDKESSGPTES